jgi:formylglycine-generating enzyme required for sulfatase activity
VTQGEYERLMGTNPSYFARTGGGKNDVAGQDTSRFPVEEVSWEDAVAFCDRLNSSSAEKQAGRRYRLPTEAEWEYACRAGTVTSFHYGSASDATKANFDGNFTYGGGAKGAYLVRTTTVGSYPSNAFGLSDMHGNVWEWCQDRYHDNYEGAPTDGSAWETGGNQTRRVLRGGSWYLNPRYARCANRLRNSPDVRHLLMGFRVVSVVGVRTP